jgi:hypothetical protein
MKKTVLALLTLLILLPLANASFGNETHKYLCYKAASDVWNNETVRDCLAFNASRQAQLCTEIRQVAGDDAYEKCMQETNLGDYLPPALIPDMLFNDTAEHYDYSVCLVKGQVNQELICGDPKVTPAQVNADKWFAKASAAGDMCTRIALFCIGSSYYGDSRFKLDNMRNLMSCSSDIAGEIDRRVMAGGAWEFNAYCTFDGWVQRTGITVHERHSQEFTFSSSTIDGIIGNLSLKAALIASTPLATTATARTTSTTTLKMLSTTQASTAPTSVTTTLFNETQAMYEEANAGAQDFVNQSFSIIDILGMNDTGVQVERGKGNVFIKAFLILLVLFGFAVGIALSIRMKLKQSNKVGASTLEQASLKSKTVASKPMPFQPAPLRPVALPPTATTGVKPSLSKPQVARPSVHQAATKPHTAVKPIPPAFSVAKPPLPMAAGKPRPAVKSVSTVQTFKPAGPAISKTVQPAPKSAYQKQVPVTPSTLTPLPRVPKSRAKRITPSKNAAVRSSTKTNK